MASKTLQVRKAIASVLRPDLMTPQFCNRGVYGGFERVCRLKLLDHALREKAPFGAIKKPPDILSRATCLLGDGLARQRPCDTGIGGSMMAMAKGSVKSPC